MALVYHKNLASGDLHVPGYVGNSDPGAVGIGQYWVDTSAGTGQWTIKVRNSGNTDWEIVGGMSNGKIVNPYVPSTYFQFLNDGSVKLVVNGSEAIHWQ